MLSRFAGSAIASLLATSTASDSRMVGDRAEIIEQKRRSGRRQLDDRVGQPKARGHLDRAATVS